MRSYRPRGWSCVGPGSRESPLKYSSKFRWYAADEVADQAITYSSQKPRHEVREVAFRCRHCRVMVYPLSGGGQHRNHCPRCLHSRHVDDHQPGDRLSVCGSSMSPIGAFQRPDGESVLVHRCQGCGVERFNRIAADDDFALVLMLPEVPPRTSREAKARQWESWLTADDSSV